MGNNSRWRTGPALSEIKREDDARPYRHGMSYGLYKAATDWMLVQEFGGRLVTSAGGQYTIQQVRDAAQVIRSAS